MNIAALWAAVKALPLKLIAVILAALLVFGGGCWVGAEWTGREFTEYRLTQEKQAESDRAAIAEWKAKAAEVKTTVVTQYVDRIKEVQVKGDTIIKQVPVYVTSKDDARCVINHGFVRVWNAANAGVPLPGTPGPTDGAPSRVKLSDVGTQHSREAQYTRKLEEQVIGLQDYIRGLKKASE